MNEDMEMEEKRAGQFGEKLRRLRKGKGLTQSALARSLRLTGRTVINYEQGKCFPKQTEVLARIATLFDVSIDYLLSDDDADAEEEVAETEADKSALEIQTLLAQASGLFAGGRLSEEDRDYVMRAINELYWEARDRDLRLRRMTEGVKNAP